MRIEHHPKLNVWVREDGCVYLPATKGHFPHWTYGSKNKKGYLCITVNGKKYRVHRLVAECYIPNLEKRPQVDHINRNPSDNRVGNLRWCTHSENNRNTSKNDRVDARGGTHRYEDYKQYCKERNKYWWERHRKVLFSDGKRRWVPKANALELLKLPVKERKYGK